MTNAEKDFYKQLLASMVRKAAVLLGGFLATHGWISSEQANGLTSLAIIEFAVSILLLLGSTVWTWAKVKYNVGVVREARDAPADTPIADIKAETLKKSSLISSV